MQKNQNKISFAEKRLLHKDVEALDNAKLKSIVKSNADSIQPEAGKQKEFQEAQANDKNKTDAEKAAEATGEDTHEKSLEAMKKLEVAGVIKVTKAQLNDLEAEVTRTKSMDKDEALETSEINVIAARIDKLKNEQVKDEGPDKKGEKKDEKKTESPAAKSETLTVLGYQKSKTELPKNFEWMKLPEGKQPEINYLEGARKIWNSSPEEQEDFAKRIQEMNGLGVEIDTAAFENKGIELIATYFQNKHTPENFAKVVALAEKCKGKSEWGKIWVALWDKDIPLISASYASGASEAMKDVKKAIKTQTDAIQARLKDPELKASFESKKGELPKYLAKINPEFVKDGKLQPAIMEYLLAGNDLMRDITLVGIAENWDAMKPKFAQMEGFLGKKIDEKASLESLKVMVRDPKKLADFEAKTKGLMGAFEMLGGLKVEGLDNAAILKMLNMEAGKGEAINIVDFVNNGLSKETSDLATKLGEVIKKVETITATANATLEKFGGKLPGLNSLASLLGDKPEDKKKTIEEMIKNPNKLEEIILETLKKKFSNIKEIQNIKTLDALDGALKEYFKTIEAQLDKAIYGLFTSGLKIKGVEIDFIQKGKEEEECKRNLENLIPKIKAQMLPIISESIAKQTGAPLIGANGEIQLDNLDKIDGDKTMKEVFKFFKEIEGKDKAEIEKYLKDNPETAKAVSEFFGNVFDTIMNSENPEIAKVRDEVAKIAPPKLMEAMSKGMLEDTFKELQEAFKKGSIGGIFEALMNVFGKIMSKVGMFMNWAKEKISPTVKQAAGALRKAGATDVADKLEGALTSNENPTATAENPKQQLEKKLNSEFGFDAKDIETTQTQDFKMEELMGEKVDFAALKTKYKFTEGVKLEDLAKQIKETNKYSATENKANKVWDFLIKLQTPPPQDKKTETKK